MVVDEVPDHQIEDRLEMTARHFVPIGMGVLTWLLVLIVVGALMSAGIESIMSVVLLFALLLLFLPIYRFRPWEQGIAERVFAFGRERHVTLAVAIALFVIVRLPVVSELLGPILGLLLLPLRAVPQVLFGAKVFYTEEIGARFGQLVFAAGRLYVEFLWLYTLGTVTEVFLSWGSND